MNTTFVKERLSHLEINAGDTKVIGVRPTKNAMEVQLVFAEIIERPTNRRALADFNASDERFGNRSIQPVWMKAMLSDVKVLMPEAFKACEQAIQDQDYASLDILNPTLGGQRLRIEITETHCPTQWELENLEFSAKIDGDGKYLHSNQYAIFMHSDIVKGDPQHRFIQHTGTCTDVFSLNYISDDIPSDVTEKQGLEDVVFERKTRNTQTELV